MKKISIAVLTIAFFLHSCSKEKEITQTGPLGYKEEISVPDFYKMAGFDSIVTPTLFQPDFEVGLTFMPLEYGTLNAITIKLPSNFNRNRITLWDKQTGAVIQTWRVPILSNATAGIEYVIPLTTPYALTKNKEYILSMNVNNWYLRKRGTTDAPYPFTVGSIQVLNYVESPTGTAQIMPTDLYLNYVVGDLGFKFKRL